MIVICGTQVSRRGFFNHFFKILIFWVVRIVKVRKYQSVKMTKKTFSFAIYIPGTIYDLVVHMCKRIISLSAFYIFFKF